MTEPTAPLRPQDDLFRHVNAAWLAETSIPADRSRYGSFHELADAAEIARIEAAMLEAARDLRFEEAAALRDALYSLRRPGLEVEPAPAGES